MDDALTPPRKLSEQSFSTNSPGRRHPYPGTAPAVPLWWVVVLPSTRVLQSRLFTHEGGQESRGGVSGATDEQSEKASVT